MELQVFGGYDLGRSTKKQCFLTLTYLRIELDTGFRVPHGNNLVLGIFNSQANIFPDLLLHS